MRLHSTDFRPEYDCESTEGDRPLLRHRPDLLSEQTAICANGQPGVLLAGSPPREPILLKMDSERDSSTI